MLLLPTFLPTRMGKSGSIVFLFFLDSGCRMFWDAASFVVQFYILPARLHGERRTLGCLKKIGFIFISTPASQPWNVSERRCSAQTRRKPRMKKKYCLMIVFFFRNWQLFFNWTLLNRENTLFGWCLVAARWRHALPRRELIRLPFNRSHTMQRVGVSVVCSDIS